MAGESLEETIDLSLTLEPGTYTFLAHIPIEGESSFFTTPTPPGQEKPEVSDFTTEPAEIEFT